MPFNHQPQTACTISKATDHNEFVAVSHTQTRSTARLATRTALLQGRLGTEPAQHADWFNTWMHSELRTTIVEATTQHMHTPLLTCSSQQKTPAVPSGPRKYSAGSCPKQCRQLCVSCCCICQRTSKRAKSQTISMSLSCKTPALIYPETNKLVSEHNTHTQSTLLL